MPRRFAWYLKPIAWGGSMFAWTRLKINKVNMRGLKPPYIMLCNHQSFVDFKVATGAIFPRLYTNVVAIDGFIGREWLMHLASCVCKRKYTQDLRLIYAIKKIVKDHKDICCMYPEAAYSLSGTTDMIPRSLGKLAKMMGVPVVVLRMSGNFIESPYWNRGGRRVPLRAHMEQIVTAEETKTLPVEEINRRIVTTLSHDDWKYQQDNNIRIRRKDSARNMEQVWYQWPACETECSITGVGDKLVCSHCDTRYTLTQYGRLEKTTLGTHGTPDTEFPHPPDWFHWQRKNVRKQVEKPDYHWQDECVVWTLKDSNGFVDQPGTYMLTHTRDGITLKGDNDGVAIDVFLTTEATYRVYDEIGDAVGQAVCISTRDQTYYCFPQTKAQEVVKFRIATEEMHKHVMGDKAMAMDTSPQYLAEQE